MPGTSIHHTGAAGGSALLITLILRPRCFPSNPGPARPPTPAGWTLAVVVLSRQVAAAEGRAQSGHDLASPRRQVALSARAWPGAAPWAGRGLRGRRASRNHLAGMLAWRCRIDRPLQRDGAAKLGPSGQVQKKARTRVAQRNVAPLFSSSYLSPLEILLTNTIYCVLHSMLRPTRIPLYDSYRQ